MTTKIQSLQAVAQAAQREKDRHGKLRHRLDLTIFSYEEGSIRIYTSQVGSSHEEVRAVEPVVHCDNRFEATGALGELLQLIGRD